MKKYIFTMMMLIVGTTGIYAQRLIKGQTGFEATIGLISDKKPLHDFFYVQAGMTINRKNGNYQFYGIEYTRNKHEFEGFKIPIETYTAEGGYSFKLLGDWEKKVSLNLGLMAILGYEVINKNENLLPNGAVIQDENSFIYGGGVRLSLETYLNDHFVLLLQGRIKAVFGTTIGQIRPSAGVGVRYIF